MEKRITCNTLLIVAVCLFTGISFAQKSLVFKETKNIGEYSFNTGTLKGIFRKTGTKDPSLGFKKVIHIPSGKSLVKQRGWLGFYRMLSTNKRYGKDGAWKRPSTARLLKNGSVEVTWPSSSKFPFILKATYSFVDPTTIDVRTEVISKKKIDNMEIFLASYFQDNFSDTYFYVKDTKNKNKGKIVNIGSKSEDDFWHMTPRDKNAWKIAKDGRFDYPKYKLDWNQVSFYKAPIGIRKNMIDGFTGLIMAKPKDCYAVATSFSGEKHMSIYMSLFGVPLKKEEHIEATVRLKLLETTDNDVIIKEYNSFIDN